MRTTEPVTVLILAEDKVALLERTLLGLTLAKNFTPFRTVVFGLNPGPVLCGTGRLDFHLAGNKQMMSFPDTHIKSIVNATAEIDTERVILLPCGFFPGDYWIDELLAWDSVGAFVVSKVVPHRPDNPNHSGFFHERLRAELVGERLQTLINQQPCAELLPKDHPYKESPLIVSRRWLEEVGQRVWSYPRVPESLTEALVAYLIEDGHNGTESALSVVSGRP